MGYRIYRGTTAASVQFLTAQGNVTSCKDTPTVRGQTYWYAVSAVNTAGEATPSSPISVVAK